jgi:chromosomal replication initiator protein
MMEDCATSMSASQGCIDDKVVVESFKEALKGRIGEDRYRMWFAHGVEFEFAADDGPVSVGGRSQLLVLVRGQFALDRLRQHFLQELRGAAMQACGQRVEVQLTLNQPPAQQPELPLDTNSDPSTDSRENVESRPTVAARRLKSGSRRSVRGGAQPVAKLFRDPLASAKLANDSVKQSEILQRSDSSHATETPVASDAQDGSPQTAAGAMSAANFVAGPSNQLAHTAVTMVCQNPATASPLFLFGPTGTGKTHLLTAIAEQLRRRHRMRRVMLLSAEQFTNDFITSVGNSGITAFRRRYREVDALLIDDVQFLGAKKATLREMLYTVETLFGAGRPLIFSGLQAPTEIPGLSRELSGRMAAGLVCSIQPLDTNTRDTLLRRWLQQRCQLEVPDAMIEQISAQLPGDGRVISGMVNVINTLQRMFGRAPTMAELRRYAGDLLRSAAPVANLNVIEAAVCEAFHLEPETLRGSTQTRSVTEPRMLAMYLSRQLTSSAYSEIARHFGGKSHSTAISAENNIKTWLQSGKSIGRGPFAMSVQEAIDRVKGLLRSG